MTVCIPVSYFGIPNLPRKWVVLVEIIHIFLQSVIQENAKAMSENEDRKSTKENRKCVLSGFRRGTDVIVLLRCYSLLIDN
jgi:hypothetical protein